MNFFLSAILPCAGTSSRMGPSTNKLLIQIAGKSIVSHTVTVFDKNPNVKEIIIVTSKQNEPAIRHCLQHELHLQTPVKFVQGGPTRQSSVYNGLQSVDSLCTHVAIHDGARPLLSEKELAQAIDCVQNDVCCALGTKVKDTLKQVRHGYIEKTIDREITYCVQTPQCFPIDVIKKAHKMAMEKNVNTTDDCHLAEMMGIRIKMIEASYDNIKITTGEDIFIAQQILEKRQKG